MRRRKQEFKIETGGRDIQRKRHVPESKTQSRPYTSKNTNSPKVDTGRTGNVCPKTQSKGSTYFLPPFFLLPCCFDFAAGPSALPLPLALDLPLASLAAWAF